MIFSSAKRVFGMLACLVIVAACGNEPPKFDPDAVKVEGGKEATTGGVTNGTSIFDAFRGDKTGVKVNRFLWTASLDVLDFLPIQSADPFTGVISTGYGVPPGGGRAYRATILISDPALDARSLNVALQSKGGPVAAGTQRAVEDAILSRARQLRIQAGKF
ncbi:DUF3576 domain-containing protein [Pseudohalocynthiibacter aestuariivivens]|uniref:DUF3576 domain-containing protein n=1 Tax=Roseovarius pelagicus TaxID=2980108 RepID=A0ABY6D963_9RHOB|nr:MULTISPECIES: DUF3576 domain-containing protein [Rhodobacterales]QIE45415.1 DUF3576 domain-containing protein [Pseudohalocynthiibacter aestuariivivens]UXX82666.1 DUF3576 domain-containing protein [Roseovarius pelagicus]